MKIIITKCKKTALLNSKSVLCLILLFTSHFTASAQGTATSETTVFFNPLFNVLLGIIILLLIAVLVFADLAKAAVQHKSEKEKAKKNTSAGVIKILIAFLGIGGYSNPLSAQTTTLQTVQTSYLGLDPFTFYSMIIIIAIEILTIWMLYKISMQLLGVEERKRLVAEEKAKAVIKQPSFIEKINASVAVEEEADIMLDHNYDGIQELDNNLPPWWKYGFYLTIVIAVIYMIHFHVAQTGKLQLAEYEDQLLKGKADMEAYRKKSANLIDENNATLLTDAASLNSGKTIYMDNCAACHGRAGEGGVGPNLTDEYWIHSGGVKDIFKTIKYGYPEKGMKAWQQDLGAKQIHEVSCYIKSLQGTNPPNPKEKQGDVYKEENTNDSIKVADIDSTQIVIK